MFRRSLASLLLVAIILLASACTGSTPAATMAAPTVGSSAAPAAQQSAPTAAAGVAPTATPARSVLAPELADFPVPSGFAVVPDNLSRVANGGQLSRAEASWRGSLSVPDTAAFYKQALAKDYVVDTVGDEDDESSEALLVGESARDSALRLTVSIWDDGDGTQVDVTLVKEAP